LQQVKILLMVWRSSQPSACKWSEGYGKNIYTRERVSNCIYHTCVSCYFYKVFVRRHMQSLSYVLLVTVYTSFVSVSIILSVCYYVLCNQIGKRVIHCFCYTNLFFL
jgi:hypothetical protein